MKRAIFITTLLLLYFVALSGKEYTTNKILTPPKLDGIFDDEIWSSTQWQGNFIQFDPNCGDKPTEQTEFKILHDDNYIYVAIRCYDNQPELINRQSSRRDGFTGDVCGVAFDSYYDKRTCFFFIVSAAGVKNDEIFSNDGDNQDMTWNPIWDVKTSIDSLGWTAEMRIPLSQLRFSKNSDIWGLNVIRALHRNGEQSSWNFMDMRKQGLVSQFGVLKGMDDVNPKKYFEISPYMMYGYKRYEPEAGNPFAKGNDFLFNVGLDGKIALTNDFMLSFSINPDFGQVEADPSVVNLSSYETYYEEKRPFFIENSDITNFIFSWNGENLFYSRRIGRQPQYYPDLADNEYADLPGNTQILGALKISGKTKNGLAISILDALTNAEYAKIQDIDGNKRKACVEPMTNYFLARVQKDINKGNTIFGAIFTNTYRNIKTPELNFLNTGSTIAGFDFTQFLKEKKYYIQSKVIVSNVFGSNESMIDIQTAPQRYMQRPDATYKNLDSNATSLTGSYIHFSFGKSGNKGFRYNLGLYYGSPKFEVNDLGYLRSTDYLADIIWIGYSIPQSKGNVKAFQANFNQWLGLDNGLRYSFFGYNVSSFAQFKNMSYVNLYFEHDLGSNSKDILRGGPSMKIPSTFFTNLSYSTNTSSKFIFSSSAYFGERANNSKKKYGFSSSISYKPFNFVSLSLNGSYDYNFDCLQYVETTNFYNSDKYILSSIDQNTVNFAFRCDINITPELTIQYYGSPFISTGKYFDFKEIVEPNNAEYFKRFILSNAGTFDFNNDGIIDYMAGNMDFNFQQFRSNFVVRWDFMHGSTFYLVWSHDQTNVIDNSKFNLADNFSELFKVFPTDVLMTKIQLKFI